MAKKSRVLLVEPKMVQFRALSASTGRNKTKKIAIPADMLRYLEWSSDQPIALELITDPDDGIPCLRLTQVSARQCGLIRTKNGEWAPK